LLLDLDVGSLVRKKVFLNDYPCKIMQEHTHLTLTVCTLKPAFSHLYIFCMEKWPFSFLTLDFMRHDGGFNLHIWRRDSHTMGS